MEAVRLRNKDNPEISPSSKEQVINVSADAADQLRTSSEDDVLARVLMPAVSEFLGALIYVLITDFLGLAGNSPVGRLGMALLEGATLAALLLMFWPFSGGFCCFNPSVTIGSMLTLNTRLFIGLASIFCQLFGSFFGALLVRSALKSSVFFDVFGTLGIVEFHNEYPPPSESFDLQQFSNRFQLYFLDSILQTLTILSMLLTVNDRPSSDVALSAGLARAVTSFIGFHCIGQTGNVARLVANNAIASIFLMDDQVWRLFYLFFFSAITAPIIAAIFYWALNTVRIQKLDLPRRQIHVQTVDRP